MIQIDEINVKIKIRNKTFFGFLDNGLDEIHTNEIITEYSEFYDLTEFAEEGEQGAVFWATSIYKMITQEPQVVFSKISAAKETEGMELRTIEHDPFPPGRSFSLPHKTKNNENL